MARPGPLQIDPSRTATLRRQFEAEVKRRYNRLLSKLIDLLVDEDALGLRVQSGLRLNALTTNAGRWRFLTSSGKLEAFQQWLAFEMRQEITTDDRTDSDDWWRKYVESAYTKGAGRAFDDVRKPALQTDQGRVSDFYRGSKNEFLRSSFGRAESVEKVKLLASRVYTDLKGVTEAVSTQLTRHLVDGLSQGRNPRDIARDMAKSIDSIGKTRSLTIAQTEILRAHNEGQLDALEKLGVKEVGVMVEWQTARDDRVCPLCLPMQGVVLKISEARGMLPRHPRCRCVWVPANVGESKRGQTRGKPPVKRALDASVQAESPNKPLSKVKQQTKWAGADAKIAQKRPKSILDKGKRSE